MAKQTSTNLENMFFEYYVSSVKLTVWVKVKTKNSIIVDTAPVTKSFIGQPLVHLVNWMRKQGGLRIVDLQNGVEVQT
jgi:hypothetical protein